jgi:hypothetical protein
LRSYSSPDGVLRHQNLRQTTDARARQAGASAAGANWKPLKTKEIDERGRRERGNRREAIGDWARVAGGRRLQSQPEMASPVPAGGASKVSAWEFLRAEFREESEAVRLCGISEYP